MPRTGALGVHGVPVGSASRRDDRVVSRRYRARRASNTSAHDRSRLMSRENRIAPLADFEIGPPVPPNFPSSPTDSAQGRIRISSRRSRRFASVSSASRVEHVCARSISIDVTRKSHRSARRLRNRPSCAPRTLAHPTLPSLSLRNSFPSPIPPSSPRMAPKGAGRCLRATPIEASRRSFRENCVAFTPGADLSDCLSFCVHGSGHAAWGGEAHRIP